MLLVKDLSKEFGGVQALTKVSFDVKKGEILSIIGPNGAGKTTVFNCISGFYKPTKGEIYFEGKEITHLKSHEIARLGIGRTLQNLGLFRGMTVLENLKLAAEIHLDYGLFSSMIFYGKARRREIEIRQEIEEKVIDLLEIESIRHEMVGSLSYGMRKRVELAKALVMNPKLLLLDEPTAGMNVEETEDIARYVLDIIEEFDITVVMIEHDMGIVMDISDRIVVLDFGQVIAIGRPNEIRNDPEVINAYLGE